MHLKKPLNQSIEFYLKGGKKMFKKSTDSAVSEKYFEEYRANVKRQRALQEEIIESRRKTEALRKESEKLSEEISAMRVIITQMIDNGWDPVEAKLRRGEEYVQTYWDDMFTSSGSSASGGSTSAIYTVPNGGTSLPGSTIPTSINITTPLTVPVTAGGIASCNGSSSSSLVSATVYSSRTARGKK